MESWQQAGGEEWAGGCGMRFLAARLPGGGRQQEEGLCIALLPAYDESLSSVHVDDLISGLL